MSSSVLEFKNRIAVIAHQGDIKNCPPNTIAAYRAAVEMGCDMLEVDIHMTSDGELVMCHDHELDNFTNGTGLVRERTLEYVRSLDTGIGKYERYKGERIPTLREFLEFCKEYPDLLVDVELKDFPNHSGEFAFESARKSLEMLDEYNMFDRIAFNTTSDANNEINEWIHETYGNRVLLHAYPMAMANEALEALPRFECTYCTFVFANRKERYEKAKALGIETWTCFRTDTEESIDLAVLNGAKAILANDAKFVLDYLRRRGLHI